MSKYLSHMICLAFLALSLTTSGQTASAEDFFNQASKEYIKQDKLTALRTLDRGLSAHPGDARLLKLAEELLKDEQQQQQQEQQQQQQQQQQEDQKDQKKKDPQDPKDQEGQDKQQEEQEPSNEKDQEKPRKHDQNIAPQDARRILDAVDRQEKDVQDKVRMKQRPATRIPIEKDW